MNKISRESVHDILSNCGFVEQPGKPGLFLIGEPRSVTPAFYSVLVRKRGEIRLGGGIGLFFRDFEMMWSASLSKEDRRIDVTLPLIMLIDNFRELIEGDVFRYSVISGIESAARQVYGLASKLPNSIDAFAESLDKKKLLGKPVSDFLHIFDYHDDDNLYFRKSVSFVHWFVETYPQLAEHLRQCLTGRQLERLGPR